MTTATTTILDAVRRRPLLGMVLRDDATGDVVRDVRVRLSMPGLAAQAAPVVTPSGVFAWRSLPGLAAWSLGSEEQVLPRVAEVSVSDPQGRYLGYHFSVVLPHDGLATASCASPPEGPGSPIEGADASLPLFSLPGRPPPSGMAVVRAALVGADGTTPAAYAMLRLVAATGETARGVADARGQVVVFLRYPRITRARGSAPLGSGPLGPRQPLTTTEWDLTLLAGSPRHPVDAEPDLCDLLDQRAARLVRPGGGPGGPVTTATLTYGRELVLPTDGPRRVLLVVP